MAFVLRVVCLALTFVIASSEAQAAWRRAETKDFNIYSNGTERELRDFATKLEVFDEALRYFHPAPADTPDVKLDIYLVANARELARIAPGSTSIAGFYSAQPDGALAVARRDGGDFAETVLFHEYTHHFMLRHFAYPYPSWLVEGWAEYYGSSKVFSKRVDVGLPHMGRAASLSEWISAPAISSANGDRSCHRATAICSMRGPGS